MTGDVLMARIKAKFDSEPVMNTLAFVDNGSGEVSGLATQAALAASLNVVLGLGGSEGVWTTGLNVQYVVDALEIIDVVPGTFPMYTEAGGGTVGSVTEDAMPPNDALCLTWRSVTKGPGGRGRTYLTGFSESAANGGYWESGTQDYAAALADAILLAYGPEGTADFKFVILHRKAAGATLVPPTQQQVVSYTVHNEVRSIGRRAVGRRIRRRPTAP